MKVTVTLNDISSFGKSWESVRAATYGKHTVRIYRALRPFFELADDFRKAQQNYIKEHAEDGQKIRRYESVLDHEGNEMSDEMKAGLRSDESDEWTEYQTFMADEMSYGYEFEVVPVLGDAQANKLKLDEIRVFDTLGLLISPKEVEDEEEDE